MSEHLHIFLFFYHLHTPPITKMKCCLSNYTKAWGYTTDSINHLCELERLNVFLAWNKTWKGTLGMSILKCFCYASFIHATAFLFWISSPLNLCLFLMHNHYAIFFFSWPTPSSHLLPQAISQIISLNTDTFLFNRNSTASSYNNFFNPLPKQKSIKICLNLVKSPTLGF